MKGCIPLRLFWRLEPAKSNFEIIVSFSKIKDFKKGSYIRLKIRFARKWKFSFGRNNFLDGPGFKGNSSWWHWNRFWPFPWCSQTSQVWSALHHSWWTYVSWLKEKKDTMSMTKLVLKDVIKVANLPSMMAMWPVWPKVNSSAGWLMLARVDSPCNGNILIW